MSTDVHQHLWPPVLVDALLQRDAAPFLREAEDGCWTLHLAGEPPSRIDPADHDPRRRSAQLREDGVDHALVALSTALGIEALPAEEALPLVAAHHVGLARLKGSPFGFWGALALDGADPSDVDRALDVGAVGLCLPAHALDHPAKAERLGPVLERLQQRGKPLFVHPGPVRGTPEDPSWWPALTGYVAQLQAAWFAFRATVRPALPQLRVVWAALAGGAPLLHERSSARGGPAAHDPGCFYDASSFGPQAVDAFVRAVGVDQLVLGTDRPVVAGARPTGLGPAAERVIRDTNVLHALRGRQPAPTRTAPSTTRVTA